MRILLLILLAVACAFASAAAAPIESGSTADLPSAIEPGSPSATSPEDIVRDTLRPDEQGGRDDIETQTGTNASLLALKAFQSDDMDECLSQLRAAVAQRPTLPSPNVILAGFHLRAGDRTEARKLLEKEAQKSTRHPQLYLSLAKLALLDGHLVDAEMYFDRLDSVEVPRSWSEEERNWLEVSVLEGRANLAERRGKWDDAIKALSTLHQNQPKLSNWQLRLAKALFHSAKYAEAYEQLDIAARRSPSLGNPVVAMANLHSQAGQYEQAEEWYIKAIAKHPNDRRTRSSYIVSLLYQGRAEDALKQAEIVASNDGSSAMLEVQRGIAARLLGRFEDAKTHLVGALEASPGHEEATYHLVLSLAEMDDEESKFASLRMAKAFAKAHPGSALALTAVGAAHYAQSEFAAAEDALRRAVASQRMRPEGLFILGKALQAQGKLKDAAKIAITLDARIDDPTVFVGREMARVWANETLP